MNYLDRLRAIEPPKRLHGEPTKPPKGALGGFVGIPAGQMPADLRSLIERVAAFFECPSDELQLMLDVAIGDLESARLTFETTARLEGLL
jgi:hypothetical protein